MKLSRQIISVVLLTITLCTFSNFSYATLINRGNGLIYDDVLDITWLQDANFAKTSGYDNDGFMTWGVANDWVNNLFYGGYGDWRLPDFRGDTTCSGFNSCTDSELGYMFYTNFGASLGSTVLSGDNENNLSLFENHLFFDNHQFYTFFIVDPTVKTISSN